MASTLDFIQSSIKNWWIPLLIGVLLIGTGIYIFSQPEQSYEALAVVFSVMFIVVGIFQVAFAISNSDSLKGWGWQLVLGILSLLAGIILISSPPELAQVSLAIFVGFYFLITSISAIATSLDMKDYGIKGWGWLTALGVLGIIVSFMLFYRLDAAGLTAVILTGINFLVLGVIFIATSFQLKKLKDAPQKISDDLKNQINDLQNRVNEAVNTANTSNS